MNIEHLREFIELSRSLNFTSTAKKLHITQPTLSNHIHALEQETRSTLIERSSKDRARLTPAGQSLLDMATQMIALYDKTVPHLRDLQNIIEGRLIIRSPNKRFSYPLMEYIDEFRQDHPEIDIVLYPWNGIDGIDDVLSGTVDIAQGYFDDASPNNYDQQIALITYGQSKYYLWVDRSHPLAQKEELSIEDLDGQSLVIPANAMHDSLENTINLINNNFNIDIHFIGKYCDSLEDFLLSKILSNEITLISDEDLTNPTINMNSERVRLPFMPPCYFPLCMVYRSDNENPSLDTFVSFLEDKYRSSATDEQLLAEEA